MVESVSTTFTTGVKVDIFPMFINKMFSTLTNYTKRSKANASIMNYLMEIVNKHEVELDQQSKGFH